MIHLVLGGARSGKSSYAEKTAIEMAFSHQYRLHYVATAIAFDKEMQARIALHQAQRESSWTLHECSLALNEVLAKFGRHDLVLVDCLTVWLNNVLFELGDEASSHEIEQWVDELVNALTNCKAHLFLVSNEVGLGVIPMGQVTRKFVDHAGWMNQKIARLADKVTFVAAGLPISMKSE